MYSFDYTEAEKDDILNSGITQTLEYPICKVYYSYMTGFGFWMEQGFNYMVVAFSYLIRLFFIWIA